MIQTGFLYSLPYFYKVQCLWIFPKYSYYYKGHKKSSPYDHSVQIYAISKLTTPNRGCTPITIVHWFTWGANYHQMENYVALNRAIYVVIINTWAVSWSLATTPPMTWPWQTTSPSANTSSSFLMAVWNLEIGHQLTPACLCSPVPDLPQGGAVHPSLHPLHGQGSRGVHTN